MQNRLLTFFALLFSPLLVIGQTDFEIRIDESKYQIGQSRLELNLFLVNNSSDTLVVFRPESSQFQNHYTMNTADLVRGQKKLSYKINFETEGTCTEDNEIFRSPSQQPEVKNPNRNDFLTLLPNSTSESIQVSLNIVDFKFCAEQEYYAAIEYSVDVLDLTVEQTQHIEELTDSLRMYTRRLGSYLEEEKISRESISGASLPYSILNANKFFKGTSKITTRSERIRLNPKQ